MPTVCPTCNDGKRRAGGLRRTAKAAPASRQAAGGLRKGQQRRRWVCDCPRRCKRWLERNRFLAEGEPKTADAIRNFERLHSLPVHICADGSVLETQDFDAVVDALYGTGFHGELRPSGLAACRLMRRLHKSGAFVLAVDLPSGINTDTGEVAEGAAHADLTVTFDSYKPLHIAEASAPLCGKIVCADIGIRDEWHPEF